MTSTTYARVVNGIVAEPPFALPADVAAGTIFAADVLAQLVVVPAAQVGEVAERWTFANGVFAAPVPVAPAKADLIAYAAAKRWSVETGGIVVGGASIDTSRDSQAMIANAHAYVVAGGVASIDYKAESGWATMDAATVMAVALAVGAHVQACFAAEKAVGVAIEAGTITTYAEIDAAAWPPNS